MYISQPNLILYSISYKQFMLHSSSNALKMSYNFIILKIPFPDHHISRKLPWSLLFLFFVCCVYMSVYASVCTHTEARERCHVSSPIPLCLILLRQHLSLYPKLPVLVSELPGSACLHPQMLGLQSCMARLGSYMGAGYLNSGLHAFKASALTL